uniref:Deacylase n=2 Tax=Cohnella candidum TaxID=2674991 RepID=A0A3G3K543_9BACL|nr:deacylase [Cohnella candidum]
MMITAGVHGKELASIYAAERFVGMLKREELLIHKGLVVIIPLVNRIAYKLRIRGKPDLNRTFPKNPSDYSRHPISNAIYQLAMRIRPEWYIDLHEANGLSQLNPKVLGQTLIVDPKSPAITIAKSIALNMNRSIKSSTRHFMVRQRNLPGSGRSAAFRCFQAKSITVETSWELPFHERVNYQMSILLSILKEASIIQPQPFSM